MRQSGYLFRQLIGLIALVCVPLLALLTYNLRQSYVQAESAAFQAVDNYAIAVSQDMDSLLGDSGRLLAYLVARPLVQALDPRRCDPALEGLAKRRSHVADVLVTDLAGVPLCASDGLPRIASGASVPWFPQASATDQGVSFSKPFRRAESAGMVSAMSRPILDARGQRTGFVTMLLDLDSLRKDWVRYRLPPKSRLTILDAQGVVMATSADRDIYVGKDVGTTLRAALAEFPAGVGTFKGVDAVERVFALKPIAQARWTAAAAIPSAEVFGPLETQFRNSVLIAAAVLVTVLWFALAMARRLVAPLADLAMTAREVAKGRVDLRASESVAGEFGVLAQDFNRMLDARAAATAALLASERRFADLLANVDMASLMVDTEGRITYCNDFMVALCGWRREELLGRHWADKLLQQDHRRVSDAFAEAMAGGPFVRRVEHEMSTKSGERRLVQWHSSLLRSADGRISGLASLGVDVTEVRLARTRELRHIDFYAALSRTNGAIVRATNMQVLFEEICRICVEHGHASVAHVSLVQDGKLVQMAFAGPAHEGEGDARIDAETGLARITDAVLSTGTRVVVNDCSRDPRTPNWPLAGAARTKSIAAFPLRHRGQVTGILALHMTVPGFFDESLIALADEMADDLSFALDNFSREEARVHAEQNLAAQEHRLAALVDTAMDAIISIDAEYRVVLFNRAASELFLIATSEAIGQDIDRFIPIRLRAAHRDHVTNFARTGSTARRMGGLHTLLALRSDGTEFPIEASISKTGVGGESLMTVVIRDATANLQAAAARLAQAEAESASRAKTSFLSRMSHELRTPLNAVLGFSQLLQRDPAYRLAPKQAQLVEHIRDAGSHLLALINDVLDVTSIEAGQIEVEQGTVELAGLLDDAMRLNGPTAFDRGVRLVPAYRQREALRVAGDARRLKQVMINLVSNAVKYNRPGGDVTLDIETHGEFAVVRVTDTGVGMDASQMAHLYEPFNRLGREREGLEGTGLGLALARELVHLMKGELTIRSEPGHGTEVEVRLPSASTAAQPQTLPIETFAEAEDASSPVGSVLYIEDNAVNLVLVEHLLATWPEVALLKAETGREGISMAAASRPDLILLDMRLPDMDGLEVLGHLAADPAARDCVVVALSASAMPEEVEAALRAGACQYWTKPLDFKRFLSGMRDLLPKA